MRKGMTELGFHEVLEEEHTKHATCTFRYPKHPKWEFSKFYDFLREKGMIFICFLVNVFCFTSLTGLSRLLSVISLSFFFSVSTRLCFMD